MDYAPLGDMHDLLVMSGRTQLTPAAVMPLHLLATSETNNARLPIHGESNDVPSGSRPRSGG